MILANRGWTTASKLARVTGLLISMAVVLGPVSFMLPGHCPWEKIGILSVEFQSRQRKSFDFGVENLRNMSSRTRELICSFLGRECHRGRRTCDDRRCGTSVNLSVVRIGSG